MGLIWKLLNGGFLAGHKTKIVGVGFFLDSLLKWLTGDVTLETLASNTGGMLTGLGIVAGRQALDEIIKALRALHAANIGKPPAA